MRLLPTISCQGYGKERNLLFPQSSAPQTPPNKYRLSGANCLHHTTLSISCTKSDKQWQKIDENRPVRLPNRTNQGISKVSLRVSRPSTFFFLAAWGPHSQLQFRQICRPIVYHLKLKLKNCQNVNANHGYSRIFSLSPERTCLSSKWRGCLSNLYSCTCWEDAPTGKT